MNCPKCGAKLPEDASKCEACSYVLTDKSGQNSQISAEKPMNVSKKNRKRAVLCLILPGLILIGVLIFYTVVAAIGMTTGFGASETSRFLRMFLGFLGVLSIISIVLGIPLSVYFGSRRTEPVKEYDERSGKGPASEIPDEIKKWNWGAAGLNIIWGAYHGVWLSYISLIPYVNWVWWIILGIMGNKWAWSKRYWKSVEEFQEAQRKWKVWGIIFLIIPLIFMILAVVFNIYARSLTVYQ